MKTQDIHLKREICRLQLKIRKLNDDKRGFETTIEQLKEKLGDCDD